MLRSRVLTPPSPEAGPGPDTLVVWQTAMALNFADFGQALRVHGQLERTGRRPAVVYFQLSSVDRETNEQRKERFLETVRQLPSVRSLLFNHIHDVEFVRRLKVATTARVGIFGTADTSQLLSLDLRALLDEEPPPDRSEQERTGSRRVEVFHLPDTPPLEMNRWTVSTGGSGCVYQRPMDTRSRGVQVPREHNRGCSFCDSNFPYDPGDDGENVRRLADQLEETAGLGFEEVYVDHLSPTHLVAPLVEELARRGVRGVNLFISTRTDVLRAHLPRIQAAEPLMRRIGLKLHVYLIGFESLVDSSLKLFNKGVSKRHNIESVHLLRHLARTRPRTFGANKHRSHGFILFHPWTTPEEFEEEVDEIVATRMYALRSAISQTKLKLISATALGYLAEKDGLLREEFKRETWTRVAQQGIYSHEVPWDFRHAQTELAYLLLNAAQQRQDLYRRLSDEVILYRTRLLLGALRRMSPERMTPALEAPYLRWLEATRDPARKDAGLDRSFAGASWRHFSAPYMTLVVHPEVAFQVTDAELFADDAAQRTAVFDVLGLATHEATVGRRRLVFVGRDRDALAQVARQMDDAVRRGDGNALDKHLRPTPMPVCCRRAFIRSLRQPLQEVVGDLLAKTPHVPHWTNVLNGFDLLPALPCSFHCGRAIRLARTFVPVLDEIAGTWQTRRILAFAAERARGVKRDAAHDAPERLARTKSAFF